MAEPANTDNVLFFTEADWIGNRGRVISHVVEAGRFQVFFVNADFYRLAPPGSSRPHEILGGRLKKILPLLQSGIFSAVAGDCIDILILKHYCRKLGVPDPPGALLSLDPDLKAFEEVGALLAGGGKKNPAREIAMGPDISWFHGCAEYAADFKKYGIAREKLFYLPACTFVQKLMNPETAEYLRSAGKKPTDPAAEKMKGAVIAAGVFNRDFATFAEACRGLGVKAYIITDMKTNRVYIGKKEGLRLDAALRKAKNVTVVERLPLWTYINCLAAARAVAVPLLNDRQVTGNLTIADAQHLGKPVVAADFATSRDFISHGKTGLLYEPGNPESLRECLAAVIKNEALSEKLGRAARASERKISVASKKTFVEALEQITAKRAE